MNQSPTYLKFRNFLITYALIASAIYLFRLGNSYSDPLQHFVYLLTLPIGLYASWFAIKTLGPGNPQQRAFIVIFTGACFAGFGQILADFYHLVYKSDILFSIAVISYFSAYLLVLAGYILQSMALKIRGKVRPGILIGFSLVALILGILIFNLEGSQIFQSGLSQIEKVINLGFVLGDISLIVISLLIVQIVISYEGGLLSFPWLTIFLGHILILISDIFLALFAKEYYQDIWPFTLIRLIWLIANLFIAAGFYGIGDAILKAQLKLREIRPKKR